MVDLLSGFEQGSLKGLWEPRPPSFVGIGAGKSGTSWWYKLILDHPKVKQNLLKQKEINFFYRIGIQEPNLDLKKEYYKLFAVEDGFVVGEWSPGYFAHPLILEHLSKVAPNTKLILVIRNPVDRVISIMNQLLSYRMKILQISKESEAIFRDYNCFESAFLQCQLFTPFQRLFSLFKRENILILQYEKCITSTQSQIKKTYQFLDIDSDFVPNSIGTVINKTKQIIPRPNERQRGLLANYFKNDVMSWIKLTPEIDLNLWEDFK